MQDTRHGQVLVNNHVHAPPRQPPTLAPPQEAEIPANLDQVANSTNSLEIGRYCKVGVMPSQYLSQPPALFVDRARPHVPQFCRDSLDRLGLTFALRLSPELEPFTPSFLSADMREAEEVEGLGLRQPLRRAPLGDEASKRDQPRLLRMQAQPKLRQPFSQLVQKCVGI